MSKKPRLASNLTLGGEQAEADPILEHAFFESNDFRMIESRSEPRCFVVGRTGSGKSAAFQQLQESNAKHTIRIDPEDLSLPYITDLQAVRYLDSLNVNLDLFWIALWKHVLIVEIIRHRYDVSNAQAKDRFMQSLREKLAKDPGKRAALDYLDEFEGRFWCETDERVREIANSFTKRVGGEVGTPTGFPVGMKASADLEVVRQTKAEQADRFQRIVNETQLAKLNRMIEVLSEHILDDQHYTFVVIDDLDRDWVDEGLANDLIRCLFRTVLDFKRVRNLRILVALRTNIFQELDFGSRGGGQEEKYRALVLNMRWTKEGLVQMLDERIRYVSTTSGLDVSSIQALLPNTNRTMGNPVDYILDRTLMRPRDAIAFVNECLALGGGKSRLTWENVKTAERSYSSKRLLALRDEWKLTYPGIDKVFRIFNGVPARMTRLDFEARCDEVMMLLSEPDFAGVRWLTELSSNMWSPGEFSSFELYQPLARTLFEIGLLGCNVRASAAPAFFFDDPLLLEAESSFNSVEGFYIHRTYQRALDVQVSDRR